MEMSSFLWGKKLPLLVVVLILLFSYHNPTISQSNNNIGSDSPINNLATNSPITSISFGPYGYNLFYIASNMSSPYSLDLTRLDQSQLMQMGLSSPNNPTKLDYAENGHGYAVGGDKVVVEVGSPFSTYSYNTGPITAIKWNPVEHEVMFADSSSNMFAFFDEPGRAMMLETWTGTSIYDHTGPIRDIEFNSAGNKMLTASDDHLVKLWDKTWFSDKSNMVKSEIDLNHQYPVLQAKFSTDDQLIASGDTNGTINIWNLSGQLIKTIQQGSAINGLLWSDNDHYILTATQDGRITEYNVTNNYQPNILVQESSSITDMKWNRQRSILAYSTYNGKIDIIRTGFEPHLRLYDINSLPYLNWTIPTEAQTYNLNQELNITSWSDPSVKSLLTTTTSTFYTDTSYIMGKVYYEVSSPTKYGQTHSNIVAYSPSAPAQPQFIFSRADGKYISITIVPTAIPPIQLEETGRAQYKIVQTRLSDSATQNFIINQSYSTPYTYYQITNATYGETYTYSVYTMNYAGISAQTNGFTTTTYVTIPSKPLSPFADISGSTVILNWTQPVDNGHQTNLEYKIYRSSTNIGFSNLDADTLNAYYIGSTYDLTYIDASAVNNTQYYYCIAAYNGAYLGLSNVSDTVYIYFTYTAISTSISTTTTTSDTSSTATTTSDASSTTTTSDTSSTATTTSDTPSMTTTTSSPSHVTSQPSSSMSQSSTQSNTNPANGLDQTTSNLAPTPIYIYPIVVAVLFASRKSRKK